jgi:hypothetical protein
MFTLPYTPIQPPTNPIGGSSISQLRDLKVGAGGEVMSVDREGNVKFAGKLEAATGTFAGALSAATGSFQGKVEIYDGEDVVVLIDPNG